MSRPSAKKKTCEITQVINRMMVSSIQSSFSKVRACVNINHYHWQNSIP
jgi:hypothetical protein